MKYAIQICLSLMDRLRRCMDAADHLEIINMVHIAILKNAMGIIDNNALFVDPAPVEDVQTHTIENNAIKPVNVKPKFAMKPYVEKKEDKSKVAKSVKSLYGEMHILDTGTQVRSVHPKLKDAIATTYKNNPDLPKGLLEALLMKESSMGYDKRSYRPSNGEYAWLGGITPIAKQELLRKGFNVNVNTPEGAMDAMAKYWLLTADKNTDVVGNYHEKYSSGKLNEKQLAQFKDMYDYYSTN